MEETKENFIDQEKELLQAKEQIKVLSEINKNFDLLVNHLDDFVWITNKDLEFTYVSPSIRTTLGFSENEFLRNPNINLGLIDLRKLLHNNKVSEKKFLESHQKQSVEEVLHKNGILIWIETSSNLIFNEQGGFEGIIGVSRDITQKKLIERKVLESEANLLGQIENTHDSIWSIDDAYCIKTLNSNFRIQFQMAFGVELTAGKSIVNALPEPYRTIWKERYDKALKGEHYSVTDHFEFEGAPQYVEVNFNPITFNDRIIGVAVFSRDITSQKIAEQNLVESSANLSALIEHTNGRIWSIDTQYNIITINSNFNQDYKTAFGVNLEKGSYALENLPKELFSEWKNRYDRVLDGEQLSIIDHFEIEGVPQYVEVNFNPIIFNKKVIGASIFSRDITDQKISEQQILESNANIKSLIESTEARIWSFDQNFKIISINTNYQNDYEIAFGYKLEKGSYALENIRPDMEDLWIERYNKVLAGEKFSVVDEFNIEGVGQFMEILFNPIQIDNRIIGATCYAHDITHQKLAEIALKESEQRFKSLVANIPSTTYRCLSDKNWTMKFISGEIFNLTGYPPEEFIDNKTRSYASIIYPEDVEYVELFVMEKLANKESFSIEYRVVHKMCEIRWVQEQGRGNFDENGNLESIDGVISDITLRKKGEQELQNSEHKFRILSDASIDLMSMNSTKEILKYISDTLQKRLPNTIILANTFDEQDETLELISISGIKSNLVTKTFDIIGYNPEGKKFRLNPALKEVFHKGKLVKFEGGLAEFSSNQFSKTSSKALQKLLNINEIFTLGIKRDKKLFAVIHFFTLKAQTIEDINFVESFINLAGIVLQRQQLVEALHQSEDKFRSFFENTGSIISIETEKEILLTNKAFQETFGYNAEESIELDPADLIHPMDRERIVIQSKKRLKGEKVQSSYLLHAVDRYFNEKWLDISATVIDFEGKKATLIVGSDITERRKADLELNKFSVGIMNSPSSIVITDIDGTIEYVNPFFCEFTGYSYEEAMGGNPNILNSGKTPKHVFEDMWSTILRGDVWNGELQNKKKNGQFYWESARIAPIFDDNGIITNFIAIKEDITERKRTLELIEQSEKDLRDINAKKDKFFSIIAHDLRSPFSGLVGLTEILKNTIKELSDEQVEKYLDLINQSTQNVFKLLENLLAWAKSQTGKIEFKPEMIILNKLVRETISIVDISAKNKDIAIDVSVEDGVSVFADENMLSTILRNLISNALKYTHKGGEVHISAMNRVYNNKPFIIIGVKDNGVGIPKDKKGKIFNIEDNYTTNGTEKEKGTGLGLILCKEFVERHDGKIWCESEENKGSTFYFSLPAVSN